MSTQLLKYYKYTIINVFYTGVNQQKEVGAI